MNRFLRTTHSWFVWYCSLCFWSHWPQYFRVREALESKKRSSGGRRSRNSRRTMMYTCQMSMRTTSRTPSSSCIRSRTSVSPTSTRAATANSAKQAPSSNAVRRNGWISHRNRSKSKSIRATGRAPWLRKNSQIGADPRTNTIACSASARTPLSTWETTPILL